MSRVLLTLCILVAVLAITANEAEAQCCYPAPVVTYRPAPTVTCCPAPAVTYRPAPAVTYRPAPVVTYRPAAVASAYPVVYPAPVVAARPVVVDTDLYVPGQPIRNALRAITP